VTQVATEKAPFKDPKPAPERIVQLAQRVLTGDILLPRFQRGFVWQRKQMLDLLDSVARNYPIGSMLLWQSRQEVSNERTIAGLPATPSRSPKSAATPKAGPTTNANEPPAKPNAKRCAASNGGCPTSCFPHVHPVGHRPGRRSVAEHVGIEMNDAGQLLHGPPLSVLPRWVSCPDLTHWTGRQADVLIFLLQQLGHSPYSQTQVAIRRSGPHRGCRGACASQPHPKIVLVVNGSRN
jgi:hypothetical protein